MNTYYTALTGEEYNVLNKIASKTKMDCWFSIEQGDDGKDYVYDIENGCRVTLVTGVDQLLEGIDCVENYKHCNLTREEEYILDELLRKLGIKHEFFKV